jgi:predicted small secreted protein
VKTNKLTFLKRFGPLLLATAFFALGVVGCNTAHGFGKDVEKTGEAIQKGDQVTRTRAIGDGKLFGLKFAANFVANSYRPGRMHVVAATHS